MYDVVGDVKLRCPSVTNFVYTFINHMILCEIEISQSMNLLIIDKVQHLKAECSCFRLWLLGIRTYS